MINNNMQVKIYINNKLYKTVPVSGDNYNPSQFWPDIDAAKQAGELKDYNVDNGLQIRIEKVQ
jgi:hypothetical protein